MSVPAFIPNIPTFQPIPKMPDTQNSEPVRENRYADICRRVVDAARTHREQWEAWFSDKADKQFCPRHPSKSLDVDKTNSVAESVRLKCNVIITHACPICARVRLEAMENDWLIATGCPHTLLHATFDNWTPRTEDDSETLTTCRRWSSAPTGALLLFGSDFGTGKSHLAVACLKAVHRGRFITHDDFIEALRAKYSNARAEDIKASLIETPFMVLDDLGITTGGKDELPALHRVLNKRFDTAKPFVLTANVDTPAELVDYLGGRMVDRLCRFAYSIRTLKGESWRYQPPN